MILGEKSERRDQSSFSFLENINLWKSLPRATEFEYPPLCPGTPLLFLVVFVIQRYFLHQIFAIYSQAGLQKQSL